MNLNECLRNVDKSIKNGGKEANNVSALLRSYMSNGGLIQDRKGNLCKKGDLVNLYKENYGFVEDSVLDWDQVHNRFFFNSTNGLYYMEASSKLFELKEECNPKLSEFFGDKK